MCPFLSNQRTLYLVDLWILIDELTCAVSTCDVELVTLVTDTPEHAKDVLTPAVHTHIVEHVTLVNVCNGMKEES